MSSSSWHSGQVNWTTKVIFDGTNESSEGEGLDERLNLVQYFQVKQIFRRQWNCVRLSKAFAEPGNRTKRIDLHHGQKKRKFVQSFSWKQPERHLHLDYSSVPCTQRWKVNVSSDPEPSAGWASRTRIYQDLNDSCAGTRQCMHRLKIPTCSLNSLSFQDDWPILSSTKIN